MLLCGDEGGEGSLKECYSKQKNKTKSITRAGSEVIIVKVLSTLIIPMR